MTAMTQQFMTMYSSSQEELTSSWLVQDTNKRHILSSWVAGAIGAETGKHLGAEDGNSNARKEMNVAVRARVMQMNKDCEFIFIPILLGAILSWLIQRLLDKLFPKT